jgi:hypothetical protein
MPYMQPDRMAQENGRIKKKDGGKITMSIVDAILFIWVGTLLLDIITLRKEMGFGGILIFLEGFIGFSTILFGAIVIISSYFH